VSTRGPAPATTVPLVACERISVVHRRADLRVVALDDVSVAVEPAQRLAIWGRSGSGKTTLLHVLGGLLVPTSGRVAWDDVAPNVAFVFQTPRLLPYFTALENVRFAARGRAGADPEELLALVGLAGKRDHLPSELSGGEQQRVAVARALALSPRLLLCDEPTGHLDSDTAGRVLDLLDALQERLGFGLVVASHDVDTISRFRREIGLVDGRVVDDDAQP
jgi:ABC-type lipoprotein export system ATPase subunit